MKNSIQVFFKKIYYPVYLIIFLSLAGPNAEAQYFGFKINSGKISVRLEYTTLNNLVIIPVKLNNQVPLNLVMDTGVRSTILTDRRFTDFLRLPYDRVITINGPGDFSTLEAYVVTQIDLHLEGVTGYDQTILVLSNDYLRLSSVLGSQVHGMIGYDFYNRFVMDFDFPNNTVLLKEPRKFVPPKNYCELPLMIEDTKPYIWATITTGDSATIRVKLMIDTGASHSLLLKEDPDLGILVPEKNITSEIGRGLGGSIEGKIGKINSLTIGDFTFRDVITSFPDPDNYPDTLSIIDRNGTIGGEILSRFRMFIDYRHSKIYLRKNQNFTKKFGYNMSGISVIAEGKDLDNYRISNVRKESPADLAGVRVNDKILTINGYNCEDMTLGEIYKIFNYDPGKMIRVFLERDNEVVKTQFELVDPI
ncbi:MAG TPA: aspartyl protease family protein [Cyclobacteriaceae bacterium]|nr:aspartyl protease family protein [Cyclobacteriaceae bacterium]